MVKVEEKKRLLLDENARRLCDGGNRHTRELIALDT